jgi:DNA topoisomerase-1
MAPEAITAARAAISKEFGDKYLPEKPRYYTAKAKNAQEAHEAIRPTDFFRTPASVRQYLDADQARLYELVWKRAIASQMQPAEIERTTVEIGAVNGARNAALRAVGSVIRFDGFIAAYTDQKEEDSEDEENRRLPEIRADEALAREAINATQHSTEPPPRYSEASLIKKLEELGIGRPSTYASTLKTLEDRQYVTIDKRRLVPDAKGRLVTAFLENFFNRYVEYDFTAELEEKLDEISDGKLAWKDVLRDFWKDFSSAVDNTKELRVTDVLDALNEALAPLVFPEREDGSNPRICPKCGTGNLSLKLGKFGAFVGCSNYPECSFTRQLGGEANGENGAADDGTKLLGKDPYTAEEITLRSGRFGPYVQRGDGKEAKRSSLPKGWAPDTIDHEKALALLSLPRDVGKHPETAKMISAGLGRYGPFVLHDGTYANVESIEDVFSIGLNRAVTVLAEKQASRGKGRGGAAAALKELGDHPDGGKIVVRDGKYGPYVNYGKINATLPKGKDPQSITIEDALALIAEKEAKGGGGKKPARKAAPAKAAAAKKAAAPKTAAAKTAKKPAAKKKA